MNHLLCLSRRPTPAAYVSSSRQEAEEQQAQRQSQRQQAQQAQQAQRQRQRQRQRQQEQQEQQQQERQRQQQQQQTTGRGLWYIDMSRFHFSHKLPAFLWMYMCFCILHPFPGWDMVALLEGLLMSAHALNLHVVQAYVNRAEGHQRCNAAFADHAW